MSELLFEPPDKEWEKEWVGMPEFNQTAPDAPYATMQLKFKTKEDFELFAKHIGMKLTPKTKSVWYPKLERGLNAYKIYVHDGT